MEIRINKEIKDYHESLFFGLSFRQFLCSAIAVGTAVGVYFGLRNIVGRETVSWLCIACAAPFAAAGFFRYNGMQLEEFVIAFIRSEFLYAGRRTFEFENYLYNLVKEAELNVKNSEKTVRHRKRKSNRKTKDTKNRTTVYTD